MFTSSEGSFKEVACLLYCSGITEISGCHRLEELLGSALLGSARILRIVLDAQKLG